MKEMGSALDSLLPKHELLLKRPLKCFCNKPQRSGRQAISTVDSQISPSLQNSLYALGPG